MCRKGVLIVVDKYFFDGAPRGTYGLREIVIFQPLFCAYLQYIFPGQSIEHHGYNGAGHTVKG